MDSSTTATKLQHAAQSYRDAGLCVLPAKLKQKRPALNGWKKYQERLPSKLDVGIAFRTDREAICVVCGAVSGNLEMIDFDFGGELFGAWSALVEEAQPGLLEKLVIETSQRGGKHVVYRCAGPVMCNTKITQRRNDQGKVITLIETRGEGGLFLCYPTPGYDLAQGELTTLPTISEHERITLLDCAWALNEYTEPAEAPPVPTSATGRPGDDFNERGDVRAVLQRAGWSMIRGGVNEYWRRPGKNEGWSATLKDGIFYCHSSNAAPFRERSAYGPFAVYALLEHAGDYRAAAQALKADGYGCELAKGNGVGLSGLQTPHEQTTSQPKPRWPEPKAIDQFECSPEIDWQWEGWAAISHITALVAKWKAGKTTLLHHVLCARQDGGNIAGEVEPGQTLVISEEHETLWAKRSAEKTIGDHARFICLPPIGSVRDWLEFVTHVVTLVERDGYTLTIFDTLAGLLPIEDENANGLMMGFLRPLLKLKDAGTATVLVTHPPKGENGDDFNMRGASALMGFADQLAALKRPEGDPHSAKRILKCAGRLGPPIERTIELVMGNYINLGDAFDAQLFERREVLKVILPTFPPGLSIDEIKESWPEDKKLPGDRTLRRFMDQWKNRSGSGTRSDPFRYWW